jgi:hypothetical protein
MYPDEFQEPFPAVRYISCGEPRHKSMSLPSGLKKHMYGQVPTYPFLNK